MPIAGSLLPTITKKCSQSDMRILHYSLGFPPYRTGGLTKFCMDLMNQQAADGHVVGLLWPGEICCLSSAVRVISRNPEHYKDTKIYSFEVINPLPVPYDEGIVNYDSFTADCDEKSYDSFLKDYAPDVIHIHTLMGLHESFLKAAKNQGIRMTFTTHDFFPICPKVTMFRKGDVCHSVETFEACSYCNRNALSMKKIKLLQSPMYRRIKDTSVVRMMRRQHRNSFFEDDIKETADTVAGNGCDYKKLREYYSRLLGYIDIVHFNSTVAQDVYTRYLGDINGCVIGLTHSDISDNRKKKSFSDNLIRMRYLGNYSGAKGFFYLKKTLDRLWETKKNFSLDIHFDCPDKSEYIKVNDRYTYSDLESVFDDTDVLVVPSLWYETFGFTVLEALSYGVPVIITNRVGAKDIMMTGSGIVADVSDKDDLLRILKRIDAHTLLTCNANIVSNQHVETMSELNGKITELLYCNGV